MSFFVFLVFRAFITLSDLCLMDVLIKILAWLPLLDFKNWEVNFLFHGNVWAGVSREVRMALFHQVVQGWIS